MNPLEQQIAFIVELDKLKSILRQTLLMDSSRRENSAEHSWHLAMMALFLTEYLDQPVDLLRVVKMLLLHDVVEIDAGDTFGYDVQGYLDKSEREERAAARLFGLLPAEQAAECHALWQEFEAGTTPEARYAVAMDRLQPLLHNLRTQGGTWRIHRITHAQVMRRMQPIADASPRLWAYTLQAIEEALAAGYIQP